MMATSLTTILTGRQRRVLVATYFDRWSDAETARRWGITPDAVKKRRYRARIRARVHGIVIAKARRAHATLGTVVMPATT